MNGLVVRAATAAEMQARQQDLAAFERGFVYPLGRDRFHIDHGEDYFAFFKALGEPFPWLAEHDGLLVGVFVAVRRHLANRAVWYVCDLKVAPTAMGRGIARRLLRAWATAHVRDAEPAFAVSMNAADGSNRMAPLAARCPAAGPIRSTRLVLFSLDFAAWLRTSPLLQRSLGPLGFHDPHGTKDIVLQSTGAPLPLLHLQHGPWARARPVPAREGAVHMFCLPAAHALVGDLQRLGIAPSASATVLHRHLGDVDWTWLSTSDI